MSYVPYRKAPVVGFLSWLPPILISGLLWWLSPNTLSFREVALAAVLLMLPWYEYRRWQRRGQTKVPLLALISLAYWAAFAMPLFIADPPPILAATPGLAKPPFSRYWKWSRWEWSPWRWE